MAVHIGDRGPGGKEAGWEGVWAGSRLAGPGLILNVPGHSLLGAGLTSTDSGPGLTLLGS